MDKFLSADEKRIELDAAQQQVNDYTYGIITMIADSNLKELLENIHNTSIFKDSTDLKDRFNNPTKDHPIKYNLALNIAKEVLSGKLPDPTEGATYFNQRPVEGLKPIGTVHYFKNYLD